MVARPRKTAPDWDRVRRPGGAPIEVKRAVFQSRRLHRKGRTADAWDILMRLPQEYDDYRELIDERLRIAPWARPLDRSHTCRWAKWVVRVDPDNLIHWAVLEHEVYMHQGPLASAEVLREAERRFHQPHQPASHLLWAIAQRLCQAGRPAEAAPLLAQLLADYPTDRELLLEDPDLYELWPFLHDLPPHRALPETLLGETSG